jgi:hypothetical protein
MRNVGRACPDATAEVSWSDLLPAWYGRVGEARTVYSLLVVVDTEMVLQTPVE